MMGSKLRSNYRGGTLLSAAAALIVSACGQAPDTRSGNGVKPAPSADAVVPIAPTDFVIAPCAGVAEGAKCAIIAAGGKACFDWRTGGHWRGDDCRGCDIT